MREIQTSTALAGYTTFPYASQVFRLERITTNLAGELRGHEVTYGVTSLTPEQADAKRILELTRGYWRIENSLHWVRDVTFDEDRSRVRKGAGARVLAAFRNLAISLFRLHGFKNIAQGLRACTWNVELALKIVGLV